MKIPTRELFTALAIIGLLIACSKPKDQALPFSQENIERLDQLIQQNARTIDQTIVQDKAALVISQYKNAIEGDLNYNFDKTFRRAYLLQRGLAYVPLFIPVILAVTDNPTSALQNGFISQRTFDLVDTGSKAGAPLTTETEQFLSFVIECQKGNSGICDSDKLMTVLTANNVVGTAITMTPEENDLIKQLDPRSVRYQQDIDFFTRNFESSRRDRIGYNLDRKYDISSMGLNQWITAPDGAKFTTIGILNKDPERKFIVNTNQVAISKRYAQLLEDEKVASSD